MHKSPQHPAKCRGAARTNTHHAPARTFHAASNQLNYLYNRTHFRFSINSNETEHNLTKINGKGHAWHNFVLSHCKTFGTRDGGTGGALATSVAPYITRNAHVSHAASCRAEHRPSGRRRGAGHSHHLWWGRLATRVGCHRLVRTVSVSPTRLSDLGRSKLANLHCNCYPTHSEVDYLTHERYYSFINENI